MFLDTVTCLYWQYEYRRQAVTLQRAVTAHAPLVLSLRNPASYSGSVFGFRPLIRTNAFYSLHNINQLSFVKETVVAVKQELRCLNICHIRFVLQRARTRHELNYAVSNARYTLKQRCRLTCNIRPILHIGILKISIPYHFWLQQLRTYFPSYRIFWYLSIKEIYLSFNIASTYRS